MPPRPTGQVLERHTKKGKVLALRFRAYGERRYITLGTESEGWTRRRAEEELANVTADVRRDRWRPPGPAPELPEKPRDPTFHSFSSEWWEDKRRELRPNTINAYLYELSFHLLPYFAHHRISQITVEEVDRYRNAKVRERDALREAVDRGEQVDRRPLSNTTINSTIGRLSQILEVAVEYGYLDRNPAAGRRRRLRTHSPQRSYLDRAEHITVLLEAAQNLDAGARPGDTRHRRALVATLVFAGLRIGELLALEWRNVDFRSGRLRVEDAKTDAGTREVALLPALRQELVELRLRSRHSSPGHLLFGTRNGRPQSASNVRSRVLTPAVEAASARLTKRGDAPLPERITCHSLRRTHASVLFALGWAAPDVMSQLGHTDPKLTLRIYARAMRRGSEESAILHALTGFPGPEATPMTGPVPHSGDRRV